MSTRIALVLYLLLLALLSFNVVYVIGRPLWWAAAPVALVVAALFGTRAFGGGRPTALLTCLLVLGNLGLIAVAVALAMPAWDVIAIGESTAGAGRMAPMFVAALGLYAASLWLDASRSGLRDEDLEYVARLLSGPRLLPSLVTSLVLTAGLILAFEWVADNHENARFITRRFLERGIIPPATVLLFFWGLLLLAGKRWNNWYLNHALRDWQDAGATAPGALSAHAAGPAPFMAGLLALAKVPERLDEGLQLLWRRYEESYLLPRYISWAVPILGFIGTVLGISLAADGIRRIIASDEGLSNLGSGLSGAIAPLGIAFDTTLIALSLSVVLTLLLSLVQRSEERTLARLEWDLRETNRGR